MSSTIILTIIVTIYIYTGNLFTPQIDTLQWNILLYINDIKDIRYIYLFKKIKINSFF